MDSAKRSNQSAPASRRSARPPGIRAESDPVHADKACRQLLDNATPLLDGLDCLLPAGDPTRDVAHDDVAEQALICQVAFAKKTQNWKVSAELLELAAVVASSESLKKKLKENLETVKKNTENNDDFCGGGYYDLPPAHLDQMESARQMADRQEFDQAIAIVETLPRNDLMACPHCLKGLEWTRKQAGGTYSCPFCSKEFQTPGSPEVFPAESRPLINKALAYCLGYRGIRRLNEAAATQNTNSVPRVIERIVENARNNRLDSSAILAARLGNIPQGFNCRCMSCNSTIYSRYMTFKFREVTMLVCGSCAESLKSEQESGKGRMREIVRQSADDFVRAGQLDPSNKFVQKQIEQARELCSTVGISFPSAPKEKKHKVSKPSTAHPAPTTGAAPYLDRRMQGCEPEPRLGAGRHLPLWNYRGNPRHYSRAQSSA